MSDYVVIQTDPQTTVVLSGVVGTGEKGDPGSPGTGYPTRVAMAGFAATNLDDANLTEAGREGLFIFSAANLSAAVTSDPLQGVYVPPTSDTTGASGAWVRQGLTLTPEMFGAVGGDDTEAVRAAVTLAGTEGKNVVLEPDTTYIISSEIIVPDGVNISGPRSAVLKLKNQVSTTLTGAGFTSGTALKTFTVTSAAGLTIGQSVMFSTGATVSPNDAYSHAGRQISNIAGLTITIAAGPNVSAHTAGAIIATTSHLLRLAGNNVIEGFTLDGNATNNTYAHWITSTLIAQEGDNCTLRELHFKDTPSDAFLCGGPSGGEIDGSWVVDCIFTNIGGNGAHYGNVRDMYAHGNRMILGNVRFALAVEQGGGASARLGHQDGAIIFSDNCRGLLVTANIVEDWICGVGALSTTGANYNDNVTVIGNEFINCNFPIEAFLDTKRAVFSGNRCRATLPFGSGASRWSSHTILFSTQGPGTGRLRDFNISDNLIKNGSILCAQVIGGVVSGNIIDNSEMGTAANAAAFVANVNGYPMRFHDYEEMTVTGNTTKGGFISLYLQNAGAAAANLCRDTVIANNVFMNAYRWGLVGSLGGTGTLQGTVLRGNIFRQYNAATTEDGTAITFNAADWFGIQTVQDLQIEANRVEFNHATGAAWSNAHNATYLARRHNKVNGVYELPAEYADDAAAAAGGVPIGAFYKTGSAIKQRVA